MPKNLLGPFSTGNCCMDSSSNTKSVEPLYEKNIVGPNNTHMAVGNGESSDPSSKFLLNEPIKNADDHKVTSM